MKQQFIVLIFFTLSFSIIYSQNIGIGIATPTRARLELNGAVDATSAIFGGESTGISLQRNWPAVGFNTYWNAGDKKIANGYAAKLMVDPTQGYLYLDMYPYGTANTLPQISYRALSVSRLGNVGIGNVIAHAPLQFPNVGNRKIVLWETGNDENQYYGFGIEGGTLRYNVDGPASTHKFYAGNGANASTLLMSIQGNRKVLVGGQFSGSRLGINAYDPMYTLEVVQTGNTGMALINPDWGFRFWELRSEKYNSDAGNPHTCLGLFYNGRANPIMGWFNPDDGSYTDNSDKRLKRNIKPLEAVLPRLMQLKPARYEMITNHKSSPNFIGLVAQEAKMLFPEIVDVRFAKVDSLNTIPDFHGMRYGKLSVIAIKAIQEQQVIITEQQKQINELKILVQQLAAAVK
ncbi:MAG: tail fiber domain-containing protein [Bacteroidota bacterium]